MASLAATNWHKPLSLVPCLSWSTASAVFLQGVMSGAIPWGLLHEQYKKDSAYEEELTKLIVSPEDNVGNLSYLMGQQFVKEFPRSLENLSPQSERQSDPTSSTEVKPQSSLGGPSRDSSHSLHSGPTKHNNDILVNNINSQNAQFHTASWLLDSKSDSDPSKRSRFSISTKKSDYRIAAVLKNSLQWSRSSKKRTKAEISEQALDFMRGIMDECTHLGNFSCPIDTDLIIIIQAMKDAYIPRDNVLSLSDLWPGAEVRYVDWGHVGAFLFKQDVFRTAIIDSFRRQALKYYDSDIVTMR